MLARSGLTKAAEIDYRCLKLLLERPQASKLKKDAAIRTLTRAYRRGELFIPQDETEQQKWWRCEARMMLGDYSDWSGWEYRDNWAATLWHNPDTFKPLKPWNGVHTPCLYIVGEQGIGDEVFFSSCLPDAARRTDRLIFECQPKMRSVFSRSFGIETVAADTRGTKRVKQAMPPEVTAWMSLGDLPRMWRSLLRHFPGTPYITPDPAQVDRFAAYRGRTGISWRGRQGQEKALITMHPGAVSLQYDQAWDEDVERPDELDLRDDIEGILGLLANLDKVVTVSTSAAHFSAAMGKETHVVVADPVTSLSEAGNIFPWKWLCGETGRTPWYGSARVYRNLNDYRTRCFPKGARLGRADRPAPGNQAEKSVVAG